MAKQTREFTRPRIESAADVEAWFGRLLAEGFNFHPDTTGAAYVERATGERSLTDEEAAEYDRAMERAFAACEREGADVYRLAVKAFARFVRALRSRASFAGLVIGER